MPIARNEEDMQVILEHFSGAWTVFRLTISFKKTKFMYTSPPGLPYTEPYVLSNESRLELTDTFVYLYSVLASGD